MFNLCGINRIYTYYLRLFAGFNFLGKDVIINCTCDIRKNSERFIHLAGGVRIEKDVWLNIPYEVEESHRDGPILTIGESTAIGRRCTISALNKIEIGTNNMFGPGVFITDHNHEFSDPGIPIRDQALSEGGSVITEDGCWFGHGSVVISDLNKDLRIGRNSIIGANSVVTKSIPPYSVMVGNPARNVGHLSRNRSKKRLVSTE